MEQPSYGIIYCVINRVSGKRYVGQTTGSLRRRWLAHCQSGSGCLSLAGAIKKYGKEAFTIEQIDEATSQLELDEKEKAYIEQFRSEDSRFGYNLRPGGNSSKPSERSKALMAKAKLGTKLPAEQKANISAALKGITRSQEYCAKQSAAKRGAKFSDAHREKLSEAKRGWKMPDEHRESVRKAATGRVLSDETKRKIAEKRIQYWQRQREAEALLKS